MTTLRDGSTMPSIGFGTYPLQGEEGVEAIASAIDAGYRLLDTAAQYDNEQFVGEAIRRSGVARDELFVTSKLAGRDHGRALVRPAIEASLDSLGIDVLDLWLIHWPNPSRDLYVESFRAMLELRDEGLVRHVGVSNFKATHLARLQDEVGELPVLNQIQLSPLMQRRDPRAWHAEHDIVTESWRPLGKRTDLLETDAITAIAAETGRSAAQVVLAWHLQRDIVPIPKSGDPARQAANLAATTLTLDEEQLQRIDDLDTGDEHVWDADEHEEL